MMKRDVRYLTAAFMAMAMLCGLSGCSRIGGENMGQGVTRVEDEQTVEQAASSGTEEATLNEEPDDTDKAASGEDLDVVEPDAADDDWYMKGIIYTDDKGNRLEVLFNDEGTLEFAINGLSLYFTTVDNFQQENNWKVYTCDDGTMVIFYPGEPAHLEISDGDYAGLYEADGASK